MSYKNALEKKYPYMQGKIFNNYLGYTDKIDNMKQKEINTPINIVFGGSMGFLQAPEILAEAANGLNDIRIIYIGDWKKNQNLNKYVNSNYVKLVDALGFDDFADYMLRNADIGFVSLKGQVSKLCIPYKFYELINFGVPVLAAIDGDLKKIIENNEYGVVSEYNTSSLRDAIVKMTNKKDLLKYKNNILKDRTNWSAEKQIDVLINIIENL
ncbi:hypothetical protein FACS1894110_19630 [Spirochaetia bacterium]|nr:hypothetical protein FACS1894110_19630 [Spirochaetia bacterium]